MVREIFEGHYGQLLRLFRRLGLDEEEARELTQDVFVRVLKSDAPLRNKEKLQTWVFTIARHIAFDLFRSRRAQKRAAVETSLEDPGTLPDPDPRGTRGPHGRFRARERRALLRRELFGLPDRQRRCLLLWASGFSYEEISEILGIGVETVRTHLRVGKKTLRERGIEDELR